MYLLPSCSSQTDSDSVSGGGGGGNLGEFDVLCSSSLSVSSANADMDRPSGSQCGDTAGESGPHESHDLCRDLQSLSQASGKDRLLYGHVRQTRWPPRVNR
ncbi:hypothetical protein EYF80_067317 [Liparis tanakae]|uniref:Uncharacterized protein n=1 Tax=Liparis tanakae TaxID=230148 RepID=A0A4Z2E1E0_9TELE|nr:hypothetical protein EYF80_067317 [Liparis tanakae]